MDLGYSQLLLRDVRFLRSLCQNNVSSLYRPLNFIVISGFVLRRYLSCVASKHDFSTSFPCTMLSRKSLGSLLTVSLVALVSFTTSSPTPGKGCRNVPGDPGWPSQAQWAKLNASVDGRLIRTIPPGAPCYQKTYNVADFKDDIDVYENASCTAVQTNWHLPSWHEQSSSSVMQTYFANNSCNPINVQGDCGIGSYVQYAINVTGDDDAKAGLKFAQKHNIRLLVRNTGHE